MKNALLIAAAFACALLLRRYLGIWALILAGLLLVWVFLRRELDRSSKVERLKSTARGQGEDDYLLPEESLEKPVVVPIEDSIDLHTFSPSDIPEVVSEYLELAARAGYREVRIIHGKGIGFQRERVRKILQQHPRVEDFSQAPPERGGWGATVARLKFRDEMPDRK